MTGNPPTRPGHGHDRSPADRGELVDAARSHEYEIAGEVIHQSVSFRSAPYPTPADLREYEAIHPGFTNRILTLTERETEHRIQEERLQTRATIEIAARGQRYAFVVVLTLVGGGIAAILTGHSVAGLAGIVTAAVALVGAFVAPNVFSRMLRRKDATGGLE